MIRMHIDWHLSHRGLKPDLQQFRKASERWCGSHPNRPDQWNACQKGRTLLFIGGYIQSHWRGELLHLAVYKLDEGGSMNALANGGRWSISRRPAHLMINATVSRFQRPTSMHLRIFRFHHAAKLDQASADDVKNLTWALDNTSIFTDFKTIGNARMVIPEKSQIRAIFLCDRKDREFFFTYTYEDSIHDA